MSKNELNWSFIFEEVIFSTSVFVDCLSDPSTTEAGNIRLNINQPHVSEMGRMFACTHQKYHDKMSVLRKDLSDNVKRRQHIECVLLKLIRTTVSNCRNTNAVFKNVKFIVEYQDQRCFLLDCVSFDYHYAITCTLDYMEITKSETKQGYHRIDKKFHNCDLNLAEMVEWLVDRISPHVLALMTPTAAVSVTHSDGD